MTPPGKDYAPYYQTVRTEVRPGRYEMSELDGLLAVILGFLVFMVIVITLSIILG